MKKTKYSSVGSRSEKTEKKRKANKIYNILLGIVIVGIIVVGASVLGGGDDEQAESESGNSAQNQSADKNNNADNNPGREEEDPAENDEGKDETDEAAEQEEEPSAEEAEDKLTEVEGGSDSNVEKTLVNESWQPIGTEQSGEHAADYNRGSVDWNEMEKALAYGTGLNQSDMILWYLGNGGSPDKAVGTVSPSDKSVTYRVYLEWVDGAGWKPSKVEQLKVNDKAR